jgi:hypothetical protein
VDSGMGLIFGCMCAVETSACVSMWPRYGQQTMSNNSAIGGMETPGHDVEHVVHFMVMLYQFIEVYCMLFCHLIQA